VQINWVQLFVVLCFFQDVENCLEQITQVPAASAAADEFTYISFAPEFAK